MKKVLQCAICTALGGLMLWAVVSGWLLFDHNNKTLPVSKTELSERRAVMEATKELLKENTALKAWILELEKNK